MLIVWKSERIEAFGELILFEDSKLELAIRKIEYFLIWKCVFKTMFDQMPTGIRSRVETAGEQAKHPKDFFTKNFSKELERSIFCAI